MPVATTSSCAASARAKTLTHGSAVRAGIAPTQAQRDAHIYDRVPLCNEHTHKPPQWSLPLAGGTPQIASGQRWTVVLPRPHEDSSSHCCVDLCSLEKRHARLRQAFPTCINPNPVRRQRHNRRMYHGVVGTVRVRVSLWRLLGWGRYPPRRKTTDQPRVFSLCAVEPNRRVDMSRRDQRVCDTYSC